MNSFRLQIITFIFIFTFTSFHSNAQFLSNTINEEYIQPIDSKMIIGGQIGTFQVVNTFQIESPATELGFESNVQPTIGGYFKYKKLPGVKIAFPIGSEPDGNETTTKGFNLGLHFNPAQNVVADLYYSRLSRFNFVPNATDRNSSIPFNDVKTTNIALNAYYILNSDKFSYKNAFCVGQKQIKNAGSWMAGIGLNSTGLEKTQSITKDSLETFPNKIDFENISAIQAAILFGYVHNWKLGSKGKGFISAGMFMGPNFHSGNISYIELAEEKFSGINYTAKALLSAGIRSTKGTQIQFKVFFNDYGYSLPGVDLRNRIVDGELSVVRYIGVP